MTDAQARVRGSMIYDDWRRTRHTSLSVSGVTIKTRKIIDCVGSVLIIVVRRLIMNRFAFKCKDCGAIVFVNTTCKASPIKCWFCRKGSMNRCKSLDKKDDKNE